MVGAVSSRPDHGVDVELAPVLEADRPPRDAHGSRLQAHALAPELARTGADQRRSPVSNPPPEPRVDALTEQSGLRQPPEEIAAEQQLRKPNLP